VTDLYTVGRSTFMVHKTLLPAVNHLTLSLTPTF